MKHKVPEFFIMLRSFMTVKFLAGLNTFCKRKMAPPVLFRSDGEDDLEKMREFQQLTGQKVHQRPFMTAP
jgi:hypothetical protein